MSRYTPVLLFLLFAAGAGCTQTIYPQGRPVDPVPVFVADYGVHSSVMLPVEENKFVEYSFGDWSYAAMNRMGPHDALGALLLSSESALGRRYMSIPPGGTHPMPKEWLPKKVIRFYAGREQVRRLAGKLDRRFEKGRATLVFNDLNNAEYVKDPEPYNLVNNCNKLTRRMLEDLGCELRGGISSTSKFKVADVPQYLDPPDTAVAQKQKPAVKVKPKTVTTGAPSLPSQVKAQTAGTGREPVFHR